MKHTQSLTFQTTDAQTQRHGVLDVCILRSAGAMAPSSCFGVFVFRGCLGTRPLPPLTEVDLAMAPRLLLVFAQAALTGAISQRHAAHATANPIRKVVNMLQMIQKKVEEEGASAEVLFQKYMCYCKTSGGALSESIEAAKAKVPDLVAGIKAAEGKLVQLKKDW